jgi:hypothetical protein
MTARMNDIVGQGIRNHKICFQQWSFKYFLIRYFLFLIFLRFANIYLWVHGSYRRQALFTINSKAPT